MMLTRASIFKLPCGCPCFTAEAASSHGTVSDALHSFLVMPARCRVYLFRGHGHHDAIPPAPRGGIGRPGTL